ncbi:hypothetical protein LK994_05585 [Ferruginibacter lapsinanis]|uniref:hypothetical protein n=1 Tax=Ferruginibacter lapsinanis TaxID=563172 RepID=UPI001E49F516|nr:hypothetical protein [Ferruginibacter lapsinanis]UEG50944.1 hypothetical protein LK994_05585 [Ferruginibacter lapsinanis]
MKNFFYLCLIVLFGSCKSQFPIAYDSNKAKNPDYKAFIRPKNGELIAGDTVTTKNERKIFKPTLYVINGQEFKSKDIREYQDASGLYTNIAGDLTRALTGPRLHVFRKVSTSQSYDATTGRWSTHYNTNYYIRKVGSDDYRLVGLNSVGTLAEWVEDNSDAYDQAIISQQYSKKIKMHRLISWGAIIGGCILMATDPAVKTSNPNPNAKLTTGYIGVALVPAGWVNLGLNVFRRRAKAGRAYAAAINLYNAAPEKKKKR